MVSLISYETTNARAAIVGAGGYGVVGPGGFLYGEVAPKTLADASKMGLFGWRRSMGVSFLFWRNGVQVADSSSSSTTRAAQNVVTCVYQCKLRRRSCLIMVSWTKTLMSQGLSVGIDDLGNHCLCKVEIKPSLFSKRKGSKNLEVQSGKIDIFWDLSCAKFGFGPEPLEGFYLAVVFNKELLGDRKKETCKKMDSDCAFSHNGIVFIAAESRMATGRLDSEAAMESERFSMAELS
ncbi:hypothetical protein LR48_Vigan347s000300 [Vigna angularis]|uniref:Uncharacterized protein n=1 Tax=Phaseolus angularis TaxID=3914 RepID=A0A0L9TA44_PHAAN|nr:hypothetical protein LR48_Vigan347s000300 [Vigna angularis]